ncbi:hypothetical protein Tel_16255 [Candidatus Tenderia electrophaga]|uniref:STAS domain-containing protein n=1 Tax=Candidatus Tenderia electrophaga TaxID=1748243 RepID=A0A0S2THG6_9GAMM|nr:hypothetical protein Tel_16255 [Candidatus Tenderia electrophaga]
MSAAQQLKRQAPGAFSLGGELSFATVPDLVGAGARLFDDAAEVEVDLAEVGRSDSAGLALLVSWMRLARRHDKRLSFHQVPEQLVGLAKVSGVAQLLALETP